MYIYIYTVYINYTKHLKDDIWILYDPAMDAAEFGRLLKHISFPCEWRVSWEILQPDLTFTGWRRSLENRLWVESFNGSGNDNGISTVYFLKIYTNLYISGRSDDLPTIRFFGLAAWRNFLCCQVGIGDWGSHMFRENAWWKYHGSKLTLDWRNPANHLRYLEPCKLMG